MEGLTVWFRFVLAVLAAWRITHLLAREDGPADLIVRLRLRLGSSLAGKLMDCFYCLNIWISAPLSLFVCSKALDRFVAWLAISGGACLMEALTEEPLSIQQVVNAQEGEETSHGMLRRETNGLEEQKVPTANCSDSLDRARQDTSTSGSRSS